jgi:hypothetical protein
MKKYSGKKDINKKISYFCTKIGNFNNHNLLNNSFDYVLDFRISFEN